MLAEEDRVLIVHRKRCTRLLVRTAGKNVKYHLNRWLSTCLLSGMLPETSDEKILVENVEVSKISKIGTIFPLVENNQGKIFFFFLKKTFTRPDSALPSHVPV